MCKNDKQEDKFKWIYEVAAEFDDVYDNSFNKNQKSSEYTHGKYTINFTKAAIRINTDLFDIIGKDICIKVSNKKIIIQSLKNQKLSLINDKNFIGTFYYEQRNNRYFIKLSMKKHKMIKLILDKYNIIGKYEFIKNGELLICRI